MESGGPDHPKGGAPSSNSGNIFLVGLMGAGKTTVGKLLAKHFNKSFFDTDHEIERRTGVNIPLIFEIEGEAGFRAREQAILRELAKRNNIVLATGGGIVLSKTNRDILAKSGTVIYLRAVAADLLQRTRYDKNRPLLQTADPLARLTQLYKERDPLYREVAHLVIDTSKQSVRVLAREIEKRLVQF
ncbi:MAG TPA: shikimate kinase [Burkholderiales bacterium]|nr:shikimate kinase [Burkholderiales bacterium]